MTIALLEETAIHQKLFIDALKAFEKRYNVHFSIHIFASVQEFYDSCSPVDILFLDIILGNNEDGLKFCRQLRREGNDAAIVITTAHDDRHKDAIQAGVIRYIEKPYTQDVFDEALLAAIRSLQTKRSVVEIMFNGKRHFVKIHDIVYVENYNKRRVIHLTNNDKLAATSSWEQIVGQLPDILFCFVQKGILINLHNLVSATANTVTLSTGQTMNIARGAKKDFEQAYARYVEALAWEARFIL